MVTVHTIFAFLLGVGVTCVAVWASAVADRIRHGMARRRWQAVRMPPYEPLPPDPYAARGYDDDDDVRPRRKPRRAPRARRPARAQPVSRPAAPAPQPARDDVRDWLIGMGYSEQAATDASLRARQTLPNAAPDAQIREALRYMPEVN